MSNATLEGWEEPTGSSSYYTLSMINQLFAEVASLVNEKLDRRSSLVQGVLSSGQRWINLSEGQLDSDAVTYGQLKRAAAGLDPVRESSDRPSYAVFVPWVPVEVQRDTVLTDINENIRQIMEELKWKVNITDDRPLMRTLSAAGNIIRQVGAPVHDTDAVPYLFALHYLTNENNLVVINEYATIIT